MLGVVGISSFQTAMALSIIFVIFSDLERAFPGASSAQLSWVVNVFTIVGASTLVLGSAVSERIGRRRSIVVGSGAFAAASMLAALAPAVWVIVLARALQALAASLTLPAGATIVMDAFPIERRSTAVGTWSAIGAASAATGPSLGGLVVDAGGWRWAFGMNLPIGIAAVVAAYFVLDESYGEEEDPIPDPVGALTLLLGVSALVFGMVQTDEWGWTDLRMFGCVLVGLLLLAATVSRSTRHRSPILRIDLFEVASYRVGNLTMFLYSVSFFGFQLVSIQFLTGVWGMSIRDAGLLSTPVFLTTGVMSILAGRISDRVGHRWAVIPGGLLWTIGMAGLWIWLDGERALAFWLACVLVAGLGSGMMWGGLFGLIMSDLTPDRLSAGASVNQTMQRIGNAFGVALAVTAIGATITRGDASSFPLALAIIVVSGALSTIAVMFVRPVAAA